MSGLAPGDPAGYSFAMHAGRFVVAVVSVALGGCGKSTCVG